MMVSGITHFPISKILCSFDYITPLVVIQTSVLLNLKFERYLSFSSLWFWLFILNQLLFTASCHFMLCFLFLTSTFYRFIPSKRKRPKSRNNLAIRPNWMKIQAKKRLYSHYLKHQNINFKKCSSRIHLGFPLVTT